MFSTACNSLKSLNPDVMSTFENSKKYSSIFIGLSLSHQCPLILSISRSRILSTACNSLKSLNRDVMSTFKNSKKYSSILIYWTL